MLEISILFVLGLIGWHFFVDWVIQPGDSGKRKEEFGVLIDHVFFYFCGLLIFLLTYLLFVGVVWSGPAWAPALWLCLNVVLHGLVDGVTVRYSNHVTETIWGKVGVLFVDQYVHICTLLLTWVWLF